MHTQIDNFEVLDAVVVAVTVLVMHVFCREKWPTEMLFIENGDDIEAHVAQRIADALGVSLATPGKRDM